MGMGCKGPPMGPLGWVNEHWTGLAMPHHLGLDTRPIKMLGKTCECFVSRLVPANGISCAKYNKRCQRPDESTICLCTL